MIGKKRGLRFRVALNFAWFGAFISLVLAVWLHYSTHELSQRLVDETLGAEMQDYQARKARNPRSLPPSTLTLSGMLFARDAGAEQIPEPLRGLKAGLIDIELDGTPYRVLVADKGDERYILLFNEELQLKRERQYLFFLASGVAAMTLFSALGGFWLARRVVAPITNLAARVTASELETAPPPPAQPPRDEVDELSISFDRHLARIKAFMARERAFTADVSHELRTPLAVIRGAVEVMEDDPELEPRQKRIIARIDRASRDMADLTRVLLHLAREENARGAEEISYPLADVVRESVDKHRHLLQGKPLEVQLELLDKPPRLVEKTLAGVVVGNLIHNAIRHTESGSIRLRLDNTQLSVEDTGSGMGEDELSQAFLPYYTGDTRRGIGIGLSLVKRICDLYGWRIDIASTPGEGTRARLSFPEAPTA